MSVEELIAEARGWTDNAIYLHPVSAHDTIRRLTDALAQEHLHNVTNTRESDAGLKAVYEAGVRAGRGDAWDEGVAAVFAWWQAPEDERPLGIVNPYASADNEIGGRDA